MQEIKTPTRDEIPEKDKRDLTHLFVDVGKWTQEFCLARTHLSGSCSLEKARRRIPEDTGGIARVPKTLDLKIERVYHYASLQLAEDSANPEYLARMGQLQNLLTTDRRGDFASSSRRSRRSRTSISRSSSTMRR